MKKLKRDLDPTGELLSDLIQGSILAVAILALVIVASCCFN